MNHSSKKHVLIYLLRWFWWWRRITLPGLLRYQGLTITLITAKERRLTQRQDKRSIKKTQRTTKYTSITHQHKHQSCNQNRTKRSIQVITGSEISPGRTMQCSQRKPLQEKEWTQETRAVVRARRKKIDRNPQQKANPRGKKGQIGSNNLQTGTRPHRIRGKEGKSIEITVSDADQLEQKENIDCIEQPTSRTTLVRYRDG